MRRGSSKGVGEGPGRRNESRNAAFLLVKIDSQPELAIIKLEMWNLFSNREEFWIKVNTNRKY